MENKEIIMCRSGYSNSIWYLFRQSGIEITITFRMDSSFKSDYPLTLEEKSYIKLHCIQSKLKHL